MGDDRQLTEHGRSGLLFAAHIFRMSLFFFVAGFFARMLFHRGGARGFWANRLKRILVPLVAGWLILFPATAAVWVWGLTRTFGSTLPAAPANAPRSATRRISMDAPLVPLLPARALRDRPGGPGHRRRARSARIAESGRQMHPLRRLVNTGTAAVAIALPVAPALFFRQDWIAWFGIPTPDHSVIPELASLIGYGAAVSFGWLIHRQADLLAVWARQWPVHLAVHSSARRCAFRSRASRRHSFRCRRRCKLGLALAYSISIWCWSLAILGIATRFLSHANATVSVADASYWIYLVHLPVVVALQVMVGKLLALEHQVPMILVASLTVLFAATATSFDRRSSVSC